MRYWLAVFLLGMGWVANAAPVQLEPFKATYAVNYRGIRAGQITFELRREADGKYLYRSTVEPTFLARMLISANATEFTRFVVTDAGVQPIEWRLDDGTSGTKEDGALKFDAATRRVTGTVEDETVNLPMEPHVQDRLSIQIEVMRMLLEGREPDVIPLIDDNKVKHYNYRRGRSETLKKPLGELETVVYDSSRANSKKVSRMWHAPALGYVPIRAERIRDGKVETVMQIVAYEGSGSPTASKAAAAQVLGSVTPR